MTARARKTKRQLVVIRVGNNDVIILRKSGSMILALFSFCSVYFVICKAKFNCAYSEKKGRNKVWNRCTELYKFHSVKTSLKTFYKNC